jgi:hypothetical protein
MSFRNTLGLTARLLVLLSCLGWVISARALDLSNAVVVCAPDASPRQKQAVKMLIEEAEKRTRIHWPQMTAWPTTNVPVIAVGLKSAVRDFAAPYAEGLQSRSAPSPAEGYRLCVKKAERNPAVVVQGNDERGVLFGVGNLLRELRMVRKRVSLRDDLDVTTAPKYPLRGHQLGYRPKCNSYDAWDLPTWEQYFRDLAVFGCNAIELIPPRSDDDADSPHFPLPPMEMMQGMSRIADSYGLDVWIWYPAMDKDYANPQTVEFALKEWAEVFAKLSRIDAVFVPGGDPGHTKPSVLMALLQKQTENLHRYHPKAQMWVSPQSFNQVWLDEFIDILKREQPAWLSGVAYGPQVRISLERLRELVPAKYPIRNYPDITHSRQCQYPVADWDTAYALTEARECINPRPEAEAIIFRKTQPYTIGFLSYSEGCNDDVNKCVWSCLGWDPEARVVDILRQYARYYIGEQRQRGGYPPTIPGHRTESLAGRPEKLALPAGALSRVLRRLHPPPSHLRDGPGNAGARGSATSARGRGFPRHVGGGANPGPGTGGTPEPGMAHPDFPTGRGALPKHWHATECRAIQGHRGGPGRQPRHAGLPAQQPALAGRTIRQDSQAPPGAGRTCGDEGYPALD